MTTPQLEFGIDEYFRKRLMPVEGAIPQLNGIDMHGDSIPAALAGGDLFEYINFEQRCNIDARIAHALRLTTEYLEPLSDHQLPRNLVDAHVEWMRSKARFTKTDEAQYRKAKTSEQQRVAEDDDIEIEIAYEECRASIDERALTTHPRCHGGDVQLQLQSSLAEFASPLHWMECRRPLSRIHPAYSCLP